MSEFSLPDMYRMHWAQPIEQQVAADIANMTDEQRMLESWLNDDVPCESSHTATGNEHCTVKVTHRLHITCTNEFVNLCGQHVVSWRRRAAHGESCDLCERRFDVCGVPVPV